MLCPVDNSVDNFNDQSVSKPNANGYHYQARGRRTRVVNFIGTHRDTKKRKTGKKESIKLVSAHLANSLILNRKATKALKTIGDRLNV
jgi:hypothetical protein